MAMTRSETAAPVHDLVFGGEIGKTESYTLYAGSLDQPSAFHPTFAIFAAGRPPWAIVPPGFKVFDRMPD